MKPTWLVTGAAGFLGSNAGLLLEGKAHRVGISRKRPSTIFYEDFATVDLRDHSALATEIRKANPRVILHAAAVSGHVKCSQDPAQADEVNVEATRTISQIAAELGARLIFISTDAVFSGETGSYSEKDVPAPFSYYGKTKRAGEEIVLETAPESLVVRTNFFGWSGQGNKSVLEFFVNSLRAGNPVHGYPDSIVTSLYVRSLVEILWNLEALGTTGIIHVASKDALSKYDFGLAVARHFGLSAELIDPQVSAKREVTSARGRNISLNTDSLAALLKHQPQSQEDGIREALMDEQILRRRL